MSFDTYEISYDSSMPVELYLFSYDNVDYAYTSSLEARNIVINGNSYSFSPAIIFRGDNLKLGNSSGNQETCTVTVLRDNDIALLYMGAPPEADSVRLQIFRTHNDSGNDYIKLVDGTISQVRFLDSYAVITITIENVMSRVLPRGKLSYYCQNCIFDSKCGLKEEEFTVEAGVMSFNNLILYASVISDYPDNYFTGGFIKMGNAYRQILKHTGSEIIIKYPISERDYKSTITVCPGCDHLFATCALKYSNTNNFSGIPYIEPYNAFNNPVGKGVYWIQDDVIARDKEDRIY